MYYTSKLWYYGTFIYYGKLWYYGKKKLWYYGQNYGSIPRTMELLFMKEKRHGRLPKTKELLFIMKKNPMDIYQNIRSF